VSKTLTTKYDFSAVKYESVTICSAYLGKVTIPCLKLDGDRVFLQTSLQPVPSKTVYVKLISAREHGLNMKGDAKVPLGRVAQLRTMTVSIAKCAVNQILIHRLREKQAQSGLTLQEQKQLHHAFIENYPVDVHFETCQHVELVNKYFPEFSGINLAMSIVDVARFDNAYFSPEGYMVYGNGNTAFYPLGTIDICGHEKGHQMNDVLVGKNTPRSFGFMAYEGHAGALHESFADVWGLVLEFYIYEKFNKDKDSTNDVKGEFDFTLGEDNGKGLKIMRDMENPEQCGQPSYYRGEKWANPNKMEEDYGGVHINSGVGNKLFVIIAKEFYQGKIMDCAMMWKRVLMSLQNSPYCSYLDLRNAVREVMGAEQAQPFLDRVGLTMDAVNDWIIPKPQARKQGPKKRDYGNKRRKW